jgi:3-phosphoshikimate 1-carboxyvinyltransferase
MSDARSDRTGDDHSPTPPAGSGAHVFASEASAVPDAVVVHPLAGDALVGTVRMPGDKSLSHRAIMLAALADGPVVVTGAAPSEDVLSTVSCMRRLGARIEGEPPGEVLVEGPVGEASDVLDCGNSGTAMRLLVGLTAGIDGLAVLTGDASLRGRPMRRVTEPLRQAGVVVDGRDGGGFAPLVVRGGVVRAMDHELTVASAQVKSCLLLAGLAAGGSTRVREPGPSRDHTERMLRWLGVHVESHPGEVTLTPGPLRARALRVAADPSSGAFWLAAAAGLPGSQVRLPDLCLNPTRTGVVDVLRHMGATIVGSADREWSGEPVGDLEVTGTALGATTVADDLVVRAIDELPVLAVAGALGGGLEVRDAAELRVKEVDRIVAIDRLLGALGATVATTEDGFTVQGGQRLTGGIVDSEGDHRIAMAAAVAALSAREPVTITGFQAVATSYPSFLQDLTALGGRWERA